MDLLGYSWLVRNLNLPDLLPLTEASGLAGVDLSALFPKAKPVRWHRNYALPDDPIAHLVFALRHEGLRQDVLKAAFQVIGPEVLRSAVLAQPTSKWMALVGFYSERLTGILLDAPGGAPSSAITALDADRYFVSSTPVMDRRWRVRDNLPGSPGFCPLVRRVPSLEDRSHRILTHMDQTLQGASRSLIERAGAYLSLKETLASFAIEREKPDPDRARRFARILSTSGVGDLDEERLMAVQHAIVENPLMRAIPEVYRGETVFVGQTRGGHFGAGWEHIHFVGAAPEAVGPLMTEWVAAAAKPCADPLADAAAKAFGLVFIHPFMDGNGRTHRWALQHLLARGGLVPHGVTVPVSQYLLDHADAYDTALEDFSRPLMQVLRYVVRPDGSLILQNDLTDAYRYFDATAATQCVADALESVVANDLPDELQFLRTYDGARERLTAVVDLPAREMDIAIHTILREGRMSKTKRGRFFASLSEETIQAMERAVTGVLDAPPRPQPRRSA
ncbi:MAG: Fic family protein, partial [Acidiferrobacteraceae bacterium]